ncbi:MAG: DUF4340 domain-containing protein [Pseudomonadota bacterium]|nr:DUF4340 domain-containing protein [Pseudomonadota bacterium]
MSRHRFALLLIAALVVLTGALYLSGRRNAVPDAQGVALFPSLAGELNAVTAVSVRKGSATPLTIHKAGDHWSVAQRADYPADTGKLRKLLLSLRDAKIVEEKTADPTRFASIGVEDPAMPDAAGIEITVIGPGVKHAVIVGKPLGDGSFVRRVGENRSYSVEPTIALETEPRYWIDSQLLDVPATLIQSIEVKPAAGAAYAIRRSTAANADTAFSLEGVPAGRQPLDGHALAPAPTTFTGLTAEDVAPAADIDFKASTQAIVSLTDGNIVTLTGAAVADKHWIQVKSSKDAALTAKTSGRAFEIAGYRYEAIFKPLEQLLIPKEPAAPKGTPAAPRGPKKPAA